MYHRLIGFELVCGRPILALGSVLVHQPLLATLKNLCFFKLDASSQLTKDVW